MATQFQPEDPEELVSMLRVFFGKQIIICSIEKEGKIDVETAVIGVPFAGGYSKKAQAIILNLDNIQVFQHYPDSRGFSIPSGRENPVVKIACGTLREKVLPGEAYFQRNISVIAKYGTEAYNNIIQYLSRR